MGRERVRAREDTSAEAACGRAEALAQMGQLGEAMEAARACLRRHLGYEPALRLIDRLERLGPLLPPAGAGHAGAGPRPWHAGQTLLDEFVVERELGQGGMGMVYLVRGRSSGQRFAVKTIIASKLGSTSIRRRFLRELQTWIDLPPHPHLVKCHFFRTIEDHLALFAEYMEAGPLPVWIHRQGAIGLEQILDVAIQVAWGLHAAHEVGVIHQDVKPGNVLIGGDGSAKVADFGLARAWGLTEEAGRRSGRGAGVSVAGLTEAYCSPEQALGLSVSRKTDVWSFGMLLLEMFTGEVTWMSGVLGPALLKEYLARGPSDPGLPAMPAGVVAVLRRCFRREPALRWDSLLDVAEVLRRVYHEVTGVPHGRPVPSASVFRVRAVTRHDRRTLHGGRWADPLEWLIRALMAEGRDPREAAAFADMPSGSRRAQAIADIGVYEEARRIYERLVAEGRGELLVQLASVCVNMAVIHGSVGDVPGATALYDRAIEIHERLVEGEGRNDLQNGLARVYLNKANALAAVGDKRGAVLLYDKAIAIRERLVEKEGHPELTNELALTYMNKAGALAVLGDKRDAAVLYDRAIEIFERLADRGERWALKNDLAWTYMGKAGVLLALGDSQGAVQLYDRAIGICERLAGRERRRELSGDLALMYMGKASALMALRDRQGAVQLYDWAIAVAERLVNQEGHRELAHELAQLYLNKSSALGALGEARKAAGLCDQAIRIYRRLVDEEGHKELSNELASTYVNKASLLMDLGERRRAVVLYDRAIKIRERLVNQEGRRELLGDLAWAKAYRASLLLALGEVAQARSEAREALALLQSEAQRTGRVDLRQVQEWAMRNLRSVLT